MTFSSIVFLTCFFPITLGVYLLLGNKHLRLRNAWLIVASTVFYGWSGVRYLLLVYASAFVNYLLGLVVHRNGKQNKLFLVLSIVFNLGLLGFFKYFNFFAAIVNDISVSLFHVSLAAPVIPLPIGISFFTFQIMSYVIDVYRGKVASQKSFAAVLLYIMLFPQLIAGPIVRYADIELEIKNRKTTSADLWNGMLLFIGGLAKKVLIANPLGLVASNAFESASNYTMPICWIGIVCYTLQIFFDFSGYSDMAIGMGRMFGFNFGENFRYPYIAKSIQDFWRRWHISLSSWFKDYVYIPLGGNRKGAARTQFNLALVFLLTGFWHGAGLNFIVWGCFHGAFQLLERTSFGKRIRSAPAILGHVYTLLVVMIGWVFFRADNLQLAGQYIAGLFTPDMSKLQLAMQWLTPGTCFALVLGILFSTPLFYNLMRVRLATCLSKRPRAALCYDILRAVGYCLLLILCIVRLTAGDYNPFIYFRF